jgi:hypothetical protein
MPAIKTLKLLAHGDSHPPAGTNQQSHALTRISSLNARKNSSEKSLTKSKSLRILSSQSNENKIKNSEIDSEQPQTGTDDGDS